MYYSQDVLEEVRTGNDVIDIISQYTQLKQKGNSYFGLCPFHKENTPSFSVSPDKQLFHCFGCGASGNVYSFIMQIENFDFVDAVKFLADKINYTLPEAEYSQENKKNNELKSDLYEIHKKSARYYYNILNGDDGIRARKYLDNRNINLNIRRKYGLGFSSFTKDNLFKFLLNEGYDLETILKSGLVLKNKKGEYYDRFFNRIMFPIIDIQGRIIGFGGRIIKNGEPKYLNSPDTVIFNKSQNLYSMNFARLSKYKEFIIVEGYMDVLSLYQAGFHNVVASLGTAFNDEHIKTLKKYAQSVILLFDSDEAGEKAVLRAIPILNKHGIKTKVLQVTDAKDPDEFIKKFGSEAFNELLKKSKNNILFQVDCIKKQYDINNIEQRIMFVNNVSKLISSIDNAVERDVYTKEIAKYTNISLEAINKEIYKISNNEKININNKKYKKGKYEIDKKGIDEAIKSIINIISSNYFIFKSVNNFIKPHEFIEPLYIKLIDIIYNLYEKGNNIYPAEIINYFTNTEEQKMVTNILISQENNFENKSDLEKALNDEIKTIKRAYINSKISNISDLNELQKLIEEKRNIDKLYITLLDG